MKNWKDIFWVIVLSIIYIACFPINPLVLTGVIEVKSYLILNILGGLIWLFGMILVMAPIVMFPRRGGVPKGKSFVSTTRIVDAGIYSILRHPQYTGGIYAIFIPCVMWYPHWIFVLLGIAGTVLTYFGIKTEDNILIEKFGDDYAEYMKRVPAMNFIAGLIRVRRKGK